MLDRIVNFIMPRVGELLVDHVHQDYIFTFDSLKRNLATLSAKASDIENEIQNAEILGKRKRKREVEEWLAAIKSIETEFSQLKNEVGSQGFISRFLGGGRAAQLNQSVDDLIQQSRHFGELMLEVFQTMGEELLTTKLIGNTFEENLQRIWRLLSIKKVSSLGIYGMGGVGKTTLAKHINNLLLEQFEERVIWVTVSQAFTIRKLQDEIARVAHVDLSDEENEDKRAARLWRVLSGRKNILILDDVWDKINLEKVGYPHSEEGFRLVITTRSEIVCRRIGCKEVVVVKTLPQDEAWKLFSEKLGNETRLAPQVEEIAKCIAEMCDGLPLGIIVLAGSMRGETTIHFWRDALRELKEYSVLGQEAMQDEVYMVLKYSFDRLDPNNRREGRGSNGYNPLQLCFLYCCLYPEDYEISKDELVRKFMSEELMDKRSRRVQVELGNGIPDKIGNRRALVDQGHCMLDKLVNVCLLESCIDGGVKMHDLVRSMALKITKGTTMVIAGHRFLKEIPNEEEWIEDLEKVSLMSNGINEIPSGISPNCPRLSTLLFSDNPLKVLPDTFFSQMHGLSTLDLCNTEIERLPNSLSALKRLKVLLLRCCGRLAYVPYLGNLKALTELDLSETAITELPHGIEELVHLKLLCINAQNLKTVRSGLLLRFPNLECLELPDHIEAPMGEIEKLKKVEVFRGRGKNVCDFNRFIRSRVSNTLFGISVGWATQFSMRNYDNEVYLQYYDFKNGEEKDEAVLGDDIKRLSIKDCEGLSKSLLDDFRGLPRIGYLEIRECGGIKCILKHEQLMEEAREVQYQSFSTLEEIELHGLVELKGIITSMEKRKTISFPPRQAAFSSLRKVLVSECHKMKKLGLPLSALRVLEHICVRDCSEMEEIVEVGRREARFVSLPKLKVLQLYSLPRLKSLCNKATVTCPSIEIIELRSCPSLMKFPLEIVPTPPSLREIWILRGEWTKLEWEHPTHPLRLQPFVNFNY